MVSVHRPWLLLCVLAFWGCPVAAAVVGELARALPGHEIRCRHLWFLSPPSDAGLHETVWAVVAMIALSAIAHGCGALAVRVLLLAPQAMTIRL